MNFGDAASTLFGLRRFAPRPGTTETAALLAHLGDPHEGLATVQVAGSNGKGSTARMLESVLLEAGLSVGLYSSPHLSDVRERVRVDGRMLRKAALTEFVERCEPYLTECGADGESPTFFETLTALALWEFDRQEVDVAILEVGIGGRHDATSVVSPLASAVTSVALEHTDVLGDDLETIARDMAAVAPADRPLVTAATGDALAAIRETTDVHTVGPDGDLPVEYAGREGLEAVARIGGSDASESRLGLLGPHQATNAGVAVALARQTGEQLGIDVEPSLERGLRTAALPGRFEVIERNPLVVLDGAHNPQGCEVAIETLESFAFERLHLVVGSMTDKDHPGVAAALSRADTVHACRADHERAEAPAVVERAFDRATDATTDTHASVDAAFEAAVSGAGGADCVLVTGSLYVVAEARARFEHDPVPTRPESVDAAETMLRRCQAGGRERAGEAFVHRSYRTSLRPARARRLRRTLLAVGGSCVVSDVEDGDHEPRAVAFGGTVAQLRRACERLDGHVGFDSFTTALRDSLAEAPASTRTAGGSGDRPTHPWDSGPTVMGILNVTPDSFHDGGEFDTTDRAVEHAREMVEAGAGIVDVGGESTRPGADPVPPAAERERVLPVIERLADLDVTVSVDTRRASTARAALEAGADMLNDVSGLEDPEMAPVAAEHDVPLVVMHSIEAPVDPDTDPSYDDVVTDVLDSLGEQVLRAQRAGLDRSQILVDPGIGFGKSAPESFELLARLEAFEALGCPVLVGHSHKSMFAHVDRASGERYEPTVAATALAVERGADVVRVHDVDANVAAVDVAAATRAHRHGSE